MTVCRPFAASDHQDDSLAWEGIFVGDKDGLGVKNTLGSASYNPSVLGIACRAGIYLEHMNGCDDGYQI